MLYYPQKIFFLILKWIVLQLYIYLNVILQKDTKQFKQWMFVRFLNFGLCAYVMV